MKKYKVIIEMECDSSPNMLQSWIRTAIEDNLNPYDELPEERVLSVNVETIEE